ncbi:MAG: pilus assembly protein, partial [Proteobacteria bacterium]|nr:pilus assembly protein [Pseudomonadota bacterium]
MNATRIFSRNDCGAALAESAIALPLIVIVFATVFAFGSTLFNTQVLETAARDAARYLARTATTSADETAARNLAVYANTGGVGSSRVRGLTTGNVAITYVTIANPINA